MTEKTKAKVLPANVKKKLEELLAPGQRSEQLQFFLQRIFHVAATVPPTDERYIAEPKATVRHILKTHPKAVTSELAAVVIEHGGELALVKEVVTALVPLTGSFGTGVPPETQAVLMRAALEATAHRMEDGWARFERKARPEVVQYLLSLGASHTIPASISFGKKESLSLVEAAALAGTLTDELAKVFKKAGIKSTAKEPSEFLLSLIGSPKMTAVCAAALIQAGYTFARTEVMREDRSRGSYGYGYGYRSRPMVKVVQAPFLSLIEHGCFDAAKVVLAQVKPDLSQTDAQGRNALHLACMKGSLEMVELFAGKRGIDLKAADANGKTPMAYALESRQSNIVGMLNDKNKATISGRIQFKDYGGSPYENFARVYDDRGNRMGGTEHSMTLAEYATFLRDRDERWLKEFPQQPYIGETAYNDEYTYTLRGGDQVPVDDIYKEHDEQRKALTQNVALSRQVESTVRAITRPAPSMKM